MFVLFSWGQTVSFEHAQKTRQPSEAVAAYRPDVDGLRALAILPVVLFHFKFLGFSGGFVGVDVFFVISGYLITSIIVRALEAERFSVAWFYGRRIRRIIPAFVVMLAVVSIASIVLFPPPELAQYALSAAAAAAFCSNVFFASQTSYFAGSDNTMPLLHTWSLGVEEQFYIIWPLDSLHVLPHWFAGRGQRACCRACRRKPCLLCLGSDLETRCGAVFSAAIAGVGAHAWRHVGAWPGASDRFAVAAGRARCSWRRHDCLRCDALLANHTFSRNLGAHTEPRGDAGNSFGAAPRHRCL